MKMSTRFSCSIPTVDLQAKTGRMVVTDRVNGCYIGHPDSIVLNGKDIFTFYPLGHGKGEIVMKCSHDHGVTWSDRLNLPENFKTSMETPTVYILNFQNGTQRVLLVSGMPYDEGGFRTAYSDDGCKTFSPLRDFYNDIGLKTIVAHASLTHLKDENGFIDQWMGIFHDEKFNNYKTILTFDENGEEHWSKPERLLEEHDDIEKYAELCEIEVVRSPKGDQLALIARAQKKRTNAMLAFSNDEGKTWTKPRELPRSLMGERHKACYAPDGRLVITYRDILRDPDDDSNWKAGDFYAWVGTYDDLVNGNEGQYRILLAEDFAPGPRSGDCGYAGNVITDDGTFVITSYGHWDEKLPEECYVITVYFTLDEIDAMIDADSI